MLGTPGTPAVGRAYLEAYESAAYRGAADPLPTGPHFRRRIAMAPSVRHTNRTPETGSGTAEAA